MLYEVITIARPAGAALGIGLVAGDREAVVDAEAGPLVDDPGLAQADQRGVHVKLRALDTRPGREPGEPLEGLDVLRPAVRIA